MTNETRDDAGDPRQQTTRPTSGWRRNLTAICIAQACSATGFSFVMPFVPLFVQDLGVKSATEAAQWAGAISAAMAISMAFAQPIWGSVADRYGRKPMLLRSMFGGAVILGLMALVQTPEQLLALRFVQGMVTGVLAAAAALIATSTPKARLGFGLGLNQVAIFVGTSVGPLGGGLIADNFGYRSTFIAAGVLLTSAGLIVIAMVRENFVRPPAGAKKANAWSESRALLALPFFLPLIAVTFLIQFGGTIIGPVLTLFIADLSGSAGEAGVATAAGTVLAAAGAVSAISAVIIGRVSDRIGHVRILVICLLGSAVTYFPQAYVQSVWELLVLRMLLGAFLGGLMPSAQALVAVLVPRERRGAAFGIIGSVNAAANGLGPLAGAGIATSLGFRAVFLATGALFALVFGWVALGFRGRTGATAPPAREDQALT